MIRHQPSHLCAPFGCSTRDGTHLHLHAEVVKSNIARITSRTTMLANRLFPTSRNYLPISPKSRRSKAERPAIPSPAYRLVGTKTWLRLRVSRSSCAHYRSQQRRRVTVHDLLKRQNGIRSSDEVGIKGVTRRTCFVERKEPERGGVNCFTDLHAQSAKQNGCEASECLP